MNFTSRKLFFNPQNCKSHWVAGKTSTAKTKRLLSQLKLSKVMTTQVDWTLRESVKIHTHWQTDHNSHTHDYMMFNNILKFTTWFGNILYRIWLLEPLDFWRRVVGGWPPDWGRSPDLSPLNFFSRGHVKSQYLWD